MNVKQSHIVLDTCCILNFYASGNFLEILEAIPAQVVVTEVVRAQELKTLQRLGSEENEGAIYFEKAVKKGLISIVDFESEAEAETFINYTSQMRDEGESATFAIAFHREWSVATDDKRAISFLKKEAPHIQIGSTLEAILRRRGSANEHWAKTTNIDSATLKAALSAIRVKARYQPPRNHPLLSWWETAMK
jgi:predicted nucleic acid-binding protein